MKEIIFGIIGVFVGYFLILLMWFFYMLGYGVNIIDVLRKGG